MTIYWNKHRERWCYHFERNKKRYSGYCVDAEGRPVTSRRAAESAEGVEIRKAEMAPKVARADDLTIAMVVADLLSAWKSTANWENTATYLREFVTYFGPGRSIAGISEADLDDYVAFASKQPIRVWTGGAGRKRTDSDADKFWKVTGRTRGPATVNRYLPVIRAIFDRAYKVRDPVTGQRAIEEVPKVADLDEPKRKARPVPESILKYAIETLPKHHGEALMATLMFGFRRSEIFNLEIADVDFEHGGVWLSRERVKDDEDAFLPGSPDAMAFMRKLVDQARERGMKRVISRQRKRRTAELQRSEPWQPINSPKRAWKKLMLDVEKAFGRRYRWHDIRAAYITHVAIKAGPLLAQKLARHSDYKTTQVYVDVADEVLRAAAGQATDRPALQVITGKK